MVNNTKRKPENTSVFSDISTSAVIAGIVAIIVGYAGSTVILFQVAENAAFTYPQITHRNIHKTLTGYLQSK